MQQTPRTTVFERERPAQSVIDASLQGSKHAPFWLDDIRMDSYSPLEKDVEADLLVIGGGYTGLWSAIEAKERHPDWQVVLLEANTVGWAASGRNGGFCEASLTHGTDNGAARWPAEIDTLEKLGVKNLDEIEEFLARNNLDCDFERTGAIDLAVEPYQAQELREEATELGPDSEFLDRDAVAAQVNSPTYLAGVWHKRNTAMIHPAKLVRALARHAKTIGIDIHEHSRVDKLSRERGRNVARVENRPLPQGPAEHDDAPTSGASANATHVVRAKKVVLGTNVFPSLLKRNRLMTVPVYDYALMTEPLSEEQLESIGWQNRQGLADRANQFHYYRITKDNRILFGGYDAIYHPGKHIRHEYEERPETFKKLASHFFTTFPQLTGTRFTHRWAGVIDTSTQFCAFFGSAWDGSVAYAAGFTGLGVGATHFAAKVLLDFLDGEDTERTRLEMVKKRPLPFPPEPLASIGIQLTRASLDKADHHEGKRDLLLRTLDAVGLGFDS